MAVHVPTPSLSSPPHLLLIGQINEPIQQLKHLLIQQGYHLEVFSFSQIRHSEALEPQPQLILLSGQDEEDSFELCEWLHRSSPFTAIPIIFLCVHPSSLHRSKIFQRGASDYLFAPFVAEEAFRRIDHHLHYYALQEELTQKESQLQQTLADFRIVESALHRVNQELAQASTLDLTTQLPNRQWFEQVLEQEWRKSTRDRILWGDSNQTTLSVLVGVIDNFGEYIQQWGEDQAEHCLKEVGFLLQQCARRPWDLVARYNELAIAVILPNTPQEGVVTVANNFRRNLYQAQFPHPLQDHLTVSLGVISAIPSQAVSTAMLLQAIENLLNHSLHQGIEQLIFDQF